MTPRLPDRTRIGIASLAALSLVVTLVAFAVAPGGKERLPTGSGALVGRHDHLALIRGDTKQEGSPSHTEIPADAVGRAVVRPATPKSLPVNATSPITTTIDDTCSKDVTAPLQARVDSAPDGSTIALSPKGCYLVPGGLSVAKRNGVTIDGRGAELRSGTITCADSTQVELANLNVTTKQDAPAMQVRDCASVAIANVALSGPGEGLAISGASHDISVSVLKAETEHAAIDIAGGQRLAFDQLALKSTKGVAINLDPSSTSTVKDLEVRNSSLTSSVADITSVGHGSIENVYVHENQLLGGRTKLYVRSDSDNPSRIWRIYNNRGDLTQTLSSYVEFAHVQDVLVANNVLQAKVVPLRAAVRFTTAQGNLAILNNDFTGACRSYAADASTGQVQSKGNRVSNC
jgi:hypothetical protein